MNFTFTADVKATLERAREEATRLRHDSVAPDHIVLGAIRDPAVVTLLAGLQRTPDEVRDAIEARVPEGAARGRRSKLPYTSQAKKVLQLAMAAARESQDSYVRTEHLLLAVHRQGVGEGARVLADLGLTPARISSSAQHLRPELGRQFRIRIDDASDQTVYEQIVAQIVEAVATRDLEPGERLPTVRQLADELDIAPGTVARAYRELEQQGVVITEGARGTRVAERTGPPISEADRSGMLVGLLRPVAVAAFHLGATAAELRSALEEAMRGIFDKTNRAA